MIKIVTKEELYEVVLEMLSGSAQVVSVLLHMQLRSRMGHSGRDLLRDSCHVLRLLTVMKFR